MTYNNAGQVTETIDTSNLHGQTTYDLRGLVVQTRTEGKGSDGVSVWFLQRTIYDDLGRAPDEGADADASRQRAPIDQVHVRGRDAVFDRVAVTEEIAAELERHFAREIQTHAVQEPRAHFVERVREVIRASPTPVKWFLLDAQAITDIEALLDGAPAVMRG